MPLQPGVDGEVSCGRILYNAIHVNNKTAKNLQENPLIKNEKKKMQKRTHHACDKLYILNLCF
jgi:hypothetical protein